MDQNLRQLHAKVDMFFHGVQIRHGDKMACQSGCSACCQQTLTLMPVELAALRVEVEALSAPSRARLRERALRDEEVCPLLESDRCVAYQGRPTICRSHGAPIRLEATGPRLDVCPLNFEDVALETLPETDVLAIDRLNTMLVMIDRLADLPTERESIRDALRRWLS